MAQAPKKKKLKKEEDPKSYKKAKIATSLKSTPVQKKVESGIPKPVANRMARRIAFTTGLPTLGGMGVFIGSYIVISKGILDIPPALTLVSSAALFLLGLIGLSYGILSASWDKNPGTILGLENIRPNITRMRSSFQSAKENVEK
tara:strand:+ start:369 stop:803 length:435 start_codon:yes stop_codon:yes gene_type:complete